MTSCGMDVPTLGTRHMLRLAMSTPFWIAAGTSLALPYPPPTRPFRSPTTTSAVNENRRPPFTTLATRLIETTRSSSAFLASSPPCLLRSTKTASRALELQSGFARRFGERLHAPVVQPAAAIEDGAFDAALAGALRDGLADAA